MTPAQNWPLRQQYPRDTAPMYIMALYHLLPCCNVPYKRMKHIRDWKPALAIQVARFDTKLHKISITSSKACLNKKNILGECSTFFKPSTWNCLHLEGINLYRNDFYCKDFVSKPPVTQRPWKHRWDRLRFVFYLCIDERRSVIKGFESS